MTEAELRQFFEANDQHFRTLARNLVQAHARGSNLDADDIYQGVLLRLYVRHLSEPFTEEPRGFLFVCLRNAVISAAREGGRHRRRHQEQEMENLPVKDRTATEVTEVNVEDPLESALARCLETGKQNQSNAPLSQDIQEAIKRACLDRIHAFREELNPRQRRILAAWLQARGSRELALRLLGETDRPNFYDQNLTKIRKKMSAVLAPHQESLKHCIPPDDLWEWYRLVFLSESDRQESRGKQ